MLYKHYFGFTANHEMFELSVMFIKYRYMEPLPQCLMGLTEWHYLEDRLQGLTEWHYLEDI